MKNIPLDSVVIVDDDAYVSQLPMDGTNECQWVRCANKIGIVAKTKQRMMGAMLLDGDRNEKYREAIRQVVKPGDIVLDAGSGTGLLSLLAAECGASTVWASEMNEVFSELSQQVMDANPTYEPQVECVAKRTTDMALEQEDLVDVIITETMDSVLTTEGMIGTIRDAKKRLGKPTVRCIPQSCKVFGRLVELSGALLDVYENYFSTDPLLIHADCPRVRAEMKSVSTVDLELFSLDFEGDKDEFAELVRDVQFTKVHGKVHALLCWWDAQLAPGVVISTNPTFPYWQDHWHHALFMLESDEWSVKAVLNADTGKITVNNSKSESKRVKRQPAVYAHSIWNEPNPMLLDNYGLNEIDTALMYLYRTSATASTVESPKFANVMCASLQFTHLRNPKLHLSKLCGFNHEPIITAWDSVPEQTFSLALYNYEFDVASTTPLVVAKLDFAQGQLTFSESNATLKSNNANAVAFWLEWDDEQKSTSSPLQLLHPLAKTEVMFLSQEYEQAKEISVSAQLDSTTNRLVFNAT